MSCLYRMWKETVQSQPQRNTNRIISSSYSFPQLGAVDNSRLGRIPLTCCHVQVKIIYACLCLTLFLQGVQQEFFSYRMAIYRALSEVLMRGYGQYARPWSSLTKTCDLLAMMSSILMCGEVPGDT
jgi:hypothetical protein